MSDVAVSVRQVEDKSSMNTFVDIRASNEKNSPKSSARVLPEGRNPHELESLECTLFRSLCSSRQEKIVPLWTDRDFF